MADVPTEYLCEVREVRENGQTRSNGGLYHRYIAKTMDDAVAWLDSSIVDTDGRYFEYTITELQVVG